MEMESHILGTPNLGGSKNTILFDGYNCSKLTWK